jgi:hypothetical protein
VFVEMNLSITMIFIISSVVCVTTHVVFVENNPKMIVRPVQGIGIGLNLKLYPTKTAPSYSNVFAVNH